MVSFFKDNGYYIIRMICTQVAMTVFGLILSAATGASDMLFLASSILAAIMYLWLLYTLCWETGIKDKIKVDGGRMPYTPLRMLRVSLVANAVNLLLLFLALVGLCFIRELNETVADPAWAATLYQVPHAIFVFIHSMYVGIVETVSPAKVNMLLNLLLQAAGILLSVGFCTLGYFLGIHNRSLGGFFGIKPHFDRR